MKKRTFVTYQSAIVVIAFCAIVLLVASASSCSFGLQPVSSRTGTIVSLRLSGIANPDGTDANRAIVQGSGFLYFRTIGGPTGDSGPFYGPYPVSSGTSFKTADIPAGKYSDIGIIFSADRLDETKTFAWKAGTYTFAQLMRLGDSDFNELISNDSTVDIDDFLNGEASTGLTGKVTVAEGKTTKISAVLVPSASGIYDIDLSNKATVSLAAQPTMVRKFFCIDGGFVPDSSTDIVVSCSATPGSSPLTLGRCALYSSAGTFLTEFDSAGTRESAVTLSATVKAAQQYYLYLEYQSASSFTLAFSAAVKGTQSVAGQTMTVNFTSSDTERGKTLYYAVYDASFLTFPNTSELLTAIKQSSSYCEQLGTLCGYGAIILDDAGSGSGVAKGFSGGTLSVNSSGLYVVSAFIDKGGRYSSTVKPDDTLVASAVQNMIPRAGDYVSSQLVYSPAAAPVGLSFTIEDLELNEDNVFFVNQYGEGSGLTAGDPISVNSSTISELLLSGESSFSLYLLGEVTMSTDIAVSAPSCVIAGVAGLAITPIINVPANPELPFILVEGTGSLILHDVEIDGAAMESPCNSPFINLNSGSSLIMGNNFVLTSVVMDSGESASSVISCETGTVKMRGNAMIKYCSVSTPSANAYAPVYLWSGASLEMYGTSSITNCTGWYCGGAVNTGANSSLFMYDSSSITNCSATQGGAVFVYATAGMSMFDNSSISSCDTLTPTVPDNNGGGIYCDGGSLAFTGDTNGSGVRITGCSAYNGGGVYMNHPTVDQLSISGFITITGNSSENEGGGMYCNGINAYSGWDTFESSIQQNFVSGGGTEDGIYYSGT